MLTLTWEGRNTAHESPPDNIWTGPLLVMVIADVQEALQKEAREHKFINWRI